MSSAWCAADFRSFSPRSRWRKYPMRSARCTWAPASCNEESSRWWSLALPQCWSAGGRSTGSRAGMAATETRPMNGRSRFRPEACHDQSDGNGMSAAAWIVVIALAGFGISAVFSAELGLARDSVVLAHLIITAGLLIAFGSRHAELVRAHLRRNWRTGVLVGLAIGALLALSVSRQPGSPGPG